jgi:hypothetical protein
MNRTINISTIIIGVIFLVACTQSSSSDDQIKEIASLKAKVFNLEFELKKVKEENTELSEANQNLIKENASRYTSFGREMKKENFVFFDNSSEMPFGIVIVKGYYKKIEAKDYGEKSFCDYFLVTEMEPQLEKYFRSQFDGGNRFNQIIDSRIAISLQLTGIIGQVRSRILDSGKDRTIQVLGFLNNQVLGGQMKPCNEYFSPICVIE